MKEDASPQNSYKSKRLWYTIHIVKACDLLLEGCTKEGYMLEYNANGYRRRSCCLVTINGHLYDRQRTHQLMGLFLSVPCSALCKFYTFQLM